ncbi:MAG: hypothetical protein D6751_03410 [Deltaproteobacteria bacterium]|nr:MAG: hypothetical protein D6751_03410 [Deltaproteobacteria bacterium]
MSSILKALKKLEEDKVRSGEVRVDIAADILRGRTREKHHRPRGWFIVLMCIFMIAIAGAAWLWLNPPTADQVPAPGGHSAPSTMAEQAAVPSTEQQRSLPGPPSRPTEGPTRQMAAVPEPTAVPPLETLPDDKPLPELQLSGIVFQADPASRMAIVNDLPVMTGGVVDGWVLERIDADQVHFVRDGVRIGVRIEEDGRSTVFREAVEDRPRE